MLDGHYNACMAHQMLNKTLFVIGIIKKNKKYDLQYVCIYVYSLHANKFNLLLQNHNTIGL